MIIQRSLGFGGNMNKDKRFKVECLECGRKFKTASILPTCPKCKGSDIDVDYSCNETRVKIDDLLKTHYRTNGGTWYR